MNAPCFALRRLALAFALTAGVAFAATPVATPPEKSAATKAGAGRPAEAKVNDPFEPIRLRIDQLLKARVNPEPLPAVLPNPFTLPNATTALAIDDDLAPVAPAAPVAAPEGPEPGSDLETLTRFAATLKIGGMVALNGKTSLYINQLLYKVGDIILMEKRDPKSAVKVVRIAPGVLTLSFNEARHAIRLKN
ncbi:MAG: hypothetical protein H7343_20185 [Undibacterium sp.]|nr:hypothetical protein [Opitutaceae bacterium]